MSNQPMIVITYVEMIMHSLGWLLPLPMHSTVFARIATLKNIVNGKFFIIQVFSNSLHLFQIYHVHPYMHAGIICKTSNAAGGGHSRRKRDTDSLLNDKEDGKDTGVVEFMKLEPSLDRVFVPSKKAIYEARKQMLRNANKFNFKNMDLVKSFPYLFEILW